MKNYGKTEVVICDSYRDLGALAAKSVSDCMRMLLSEKDEISMIFAASESQATFLDALAEESDIDWSRVVCFNMDEFYGADIPYACTCINQLQQQLYNKVNPKACHVPKYDAPDAQAEAERYSSLFAEYEPIDILCQGIGRSGHLALNEPGITTFDDPQTVKVVDVCAESLTQLQDDDNFRSSVDSLGKGITLTIPAMMKCKNIFTMVPLATKRPILERVLALKGPTEDLPASILYDNEGTLYVDRDSCPNFLQ